MSGMTWEGWGVIIALLGVAGTGIAAIVAALKITSKIAFVSGEFFAHFSNLNKTITDFKKMFEKHMEDEEKRVEGMWKKIDHHGDKIIEHEQKIYHIEKSMEKQA